MPKKNHRDRKTKMQILRNIKEFLDESDGKPFYKSDLRVKGIDPRTAEEFFRIVEFCQKELPRLRIIETSEHFIVQTIGAEDIISEFRESVMTRRERATEKEAEEIGAKTTARRRA